MASNNPNRLSALNTHWHNRSMSSVTSDAATFHTALGHVELSPMEAPQSKSSTPRPISQELMSTPLNPPYTEPTPSSPNIESSQMARQDSGYSDGIRSSHSSRRTSTSSSHNNRPHQKRTRRPTTHRSSRSSPSTMAAPSNTSTTNLRTSSSKRPLIHSRHTAPQTRPSSRPQSQPRSQSTYQFYQFPTLDPTPPSTSHQPHQFFHHSHTQSLPQPVQPQHPHPPPTIQYWTSDSTRRLEYAAIDAASHGIRGFFTKLVPDCFLPQAARRTRFHGGDGADSDAGSVRRYRIPVPDIGGEGEKGCGGGEGSGSGGKKPGFLRRLSTGLGRGR